MSFAHTNGRDPTETEVRAHMKVLIGVDPHKASVAVAVVDEAVGELIGSPYPCWASESPGPAKLG